MYINIATWSLWKRSSPTPELDSPTPELDSWFQKTKGPFHQNPQLPFKIPRIPTNRDHKPLDRGTLGGLGRSPYNKNHSMLDQSMKTLFRSPCNKGHSIPELFLASPVDGKSPLTCVLNLGASISWRPILWVSL